MTTIHAGTISQGGIITSRQAASLTLYRGSTDERFIYHLTQTEAGAEQSPGWDSNESVVVIARDSKVARALAAGLSGDENRNNPRFWLDPALTKIQKIGLARKVNGRTPARERVVVAEFRAG